MDRLLALAKRRREAGYRPPKRAKTKRRGRAWHRKRMISKEGYDSMLVAQGGVCAICRKPCSTGRSLALDHCHSTGAIRGLLCFKCNTSIAHYELYGDRFAEYLAPHRAEATAA